MAARRARRAVCLAALLLQNVPTATSVKVQKVHVNTSAEARGWAYEYLQGACRDSNGLEVQGYGCSFADGNQCKNMADDAYPYSFGYMFKNDGSADCRVLGLKSELA